MKKGALFVQNSVSFTVTLIDALPLAFEWFIKKRINIYFLNTTLPLIYQSWSQIRRPFPELLCTTSFRGWSQEA